MSWSVLTTMWPAAGFHQEHTLWLMATVLLVCPAWCEPLVGYEELLLLVGLCKAPCEITAFCKTEITLPLAYFTSHVQNLAVQIL